MGQHCCVGLGGYIGSQVSTAVWVQGAALAVMGLHCCVGPGCYIGSQVSTAVWVQGAALAVKGQHCCVGLGGCIDSHGSSQLCESRRLNLDNTQIIPESYDDI